MPMVQTYVLDPMVQTYVLDPMAGDLCPKHLCVSDNPTLIDRLTSYALYVVSSYALELFWFSDNINLYGDL